MLALVEQAAAATGELLMQMVALEQLVEAATGIWLVQMAMFVETASEAVPMVKLA